MNYHKELSKIFDKYQPISSGNRNEKMHFETLDLLTRALSYSFKRGVKMAQGVYKRAYEQEVTK